MWKREYMFLLFHRRIGQFEDLNICLVYILPFLRLPQRDFLFLFVMRDSIYLHYSGVTVPIHLHLIEQGLYLMIEQFI